MRARGSRKKPEGRKPGDRVEPAAPTPDPAGWRKWLLTAVAVSIGILPFVLLETGLRSFHYGYSPDFLVRIPDREAYTTNQKYGWRFFPHAIARTPQPAEIPVHKPARSFRIFVLGESAAMGVPEPAFSFGRILEASLRDRFPGVSFQVVNAAMTAINSHVVLPIARDCASRGADLFVIYLGNNEVVGPYGPGTVFSGWSPPLPLIRAGIRLKGTRTAQLFENTARRLRRQPEEIRDWGGMAMFRDRFVAADDPRMNRVYADFRRNLEDICRAAVRAGAGVVLSTVAVNLRDCAPFASLHRQDLPAADRARWERAYNRGIELAQSGDYAAAAGEFSTAAKVDDRFADLHFRLAQCLLASNRPEEARRQFATARDLDALRFRADTRINEIIREVAASFPAGRVRLVDAARGFDESAGAGGIPGDSLFYEHVHMNFAGNYLLAREVFPAVTAALHLHGSGAAVPPAMDRAAELLALTGWNRYRMASDMTAMMEQPPFTNQLDHAARIAAARQRLLAMKAEGTSPEALERASRAYADALRRVPGDLELRFQAAQLLEARGDRDGAARQWRFLLDRVPDVTLWLTAFGDVLRDRGDLNGAIEQYRRALEIDPELAAAHFSMATVLEKQGKREEAVAGYVEALRLKPDYPEAHNSLGVALMRLGRTDEAISHYSAALRLKPGYAEAHNNLGLVLAALGRTTEAIAEFEEALRLNPDFAGAHYDLGGVLARTGRIREAAAHFSAAARLRPGFAEAHYALAGAFAALGDAREAAAQYTETLRLRPGFAEAHYNLGALLARQRDYSGAVAQYTEALRLRPDYPEAENNLGSALARAGQPAQSIPHFRRALELKPDYAEAQHNLGIALAAVSKDRRN